LLRLGRRAKKEFAQCRAAHGLRRELDPPRHRCARPRLGGRPKRVHLRQRGGPGIPRQERGGIGDHAVVRGLHTGALQHARAGFVERAQFVGQRFGHRPHPERRPVGGRFLHQLAHGLREHGRPQRIAFGLDAVEAERGAHEAVQIGERLFEQRFQLHRETRRFDRFGDFAVVHERERRR
jgi:hypothetical protein